MNVQVVDYQAADASALLTRSLKETGFAVLKNHPIPHELFDHVTEDWEKFFADEKLKQEFMYDKNACPQDGYFPSEKAKGEVYKDLKEFFQIYPHGRMPAGPGKASWELFHSLYDIGVTLLGWIQDNTPEAVRAKFSMPLPEMADPDVQTLLRIIHYPPQKGDEQAGAIRAAEHEDINLITILPSSGEPGLEALDMNGHWHAVPSHPGYIVINSGDPLQMCSEGYYRATKHRVRNPDASRMHKPRYSFPLFLHCKDNVVLNTKTGFTARDYLLERLEELGLR